MDSGRLSFAALASSAFAAQETYVVGAGGTYRPFEFENNQKQLEGFDIDLIKAIAKAENFNIKLINTPWEGIFATTGFRRSRHHYFWHYHYR